MNAPTGDGLTQREHLVLAATGLVPDEEAQRQLDAEPQMPQGCEAVWAIFMDLHIRRAFNEHGPIRFAWTDIYAYMGVTASRLTGWQLKTVFMLEGLYFKVRAETKL